MREGEDAETEIDEDGSLADEGEGPHGLLHGDLSDGGEVVVGVVGHHQAAEEDGHDTGEVDPLCQGVRGVDEAEHEGELQAGVGVQVDVLQDQGADESHQGPDGGTAEEHSEEPGDSAGDLTDDSNVGLALRLYDGGGEYNGHRVIENALSEHQHVEDRINVQH